MTVPCMLPAAVRSASASTVRIFRSSIQSSSSRCVRFAVADDPATLATGRALPPSRSTGWIAPASPGAREQTLNGSRHTPIIALTNETFLCNRSDQRAIARKNKAARKAACTTRARTVLCIEKPSVGSERAVEPQRMIKARRLDRALEHRAAVRDQGCIKQRHVRSIGQYALVNRQIVRQASGGADPDIEHRLHRLAAEITLELDGPEFDRPLALV